MKLFRHIVSQYPLILVLACISALFYYHFDYSTLGSWDEGWYASISHEMVRSGEWLKMNWNGKLFYDHPPMGMWLIAVSYLVFGVNEFATRLPSVIAGILTAVAMYGIGYTLTRKKIIGCIAAIILSTCVWYTIRVRSGNLDALFVCFYVWSVYAALLARSNIRWIILCGMSFACLMLTKTLVGLSCGPLVLFLVFPRLRSVRSYVWIILSVCIFFAIVLPWYYVNYYAASDFYQHHFLTIGTRDKSFDSYFKISPSLPLFYLHMGVRKWYWVWVGIAAYLLFYLRFRKWQIAFVLLWNIIVLYPFLTSDQTQIWHLIPVYVPLSLVIALGIDDISLFVYQIQRRYTRTTFPLHSYVLGLLSIALFCIALWQIKIFIPEVYPSTRSIPDDVAIARSAANVKGELYLDDDYLPLAVFYSGRFIKQLAYEPEGKKTLVQLFQSSERSFTVITRNWALNNLKEANLPYRIVTQNVSFSMITRK